MIILAIDPAPEKSAWLLFDTDTNAPVNGRFAISGNGGVIGHCRDARRYGWHVVIEMVASYGMPVGKSIFQTVLWTGAFWQATERSASLLGRKEVALHLCNSMRARDSNIRQALIDRFPATGGGKTPQIGIKKKPGPLHGIKEAGGKDLWSALALAVTYADQLTKLVF